MGRSFASMPVFLACWRFGFPWLVIAATLSKFCKCGVREYLKWLIDQTPRSMPDQLQMLIKRLGQHFEFQSAQRLAMARIEELCDQSGGKRWMMIIDKMDQNAAMLPCVWPMMRSSFFREGDRLQVSLIGCWWHGAVITPPQLIRTVFEDCVHGTEMTASNILLNLHDRVCPENRMPEELAIGADNTPKETKSNCVFMFAMWLLITLCDTPLWSITFLFLIVGHTHNKLDRFSHVKIAMQGKD